VLHASKNTKSNMTACHWPEKKCTLIIFVCAWCEKKQNKKITKNLHVAFPPMRGHRWWWVLQVMLQG
jgi:hypothetical protein